MAKDTFYFSHDYNARNDGKIKKLLSKHGYLGYGLFWAIIEDLYNNTNVLRLDYESIAFDLRTTKEVVKSIINDFDLFVFEGDNFGSLSVQKRLEERNKKSAKARESVLKRWSKDTFVLPPNYDSNTIKESKGKESKGKEKKEVLPEVKKLRGDCREFFKQHYHSIKGTEYYWVAKDAAALISLISQIRLKIKERKNTNEISNEDLFLGFQLVINNISDTWILNNYSITNISSKFNEIYTKIKHGNNTKTISKYHN